MTTTRTQVRRRAEVTSFPGRAKDLITVYSDSVALGTSGEREGEMGNSGLSYWNDTF